MTEPYYADEDVTLYQGRCEDILPTLVLSGSVHLLTDPPYFQVKDDDWDNQWEERAHFLEWMGEWLDLAKPHLTPDASVWVFASPELTAEVEQTVADRFRVLNSVRWVKEHGWHKKAELAAARRFLTAWEGIVFAEQPGASLREDAIRGEIFEPLRRYLDQQRNAAGLTVAQINEAWQTRRGTRGQMAAHWFGRAQWALPSESHHQFLTELGLDLRPHFELRREYDRLHVDYSTRHRRTFALKSRARSTDVWQFGNVPGYPGKHPCEKPLGLLTHMIETTTRPGDTVLDPFTGSGAILDAARKLGRKAVGIEMDPKWCRRAASRLGQQVLDFGDWEEETA